MITTSEEGYAEEVAIELGSVSVERSPRSLDVSRQGELPFADRFSSVA